MQDHCNRREADPKETELAFLSFSYRISFLFQINWSSQCIEYYLHATETSGAKGY